MTYVLKKYFKIIVQASINTGFKNKAEYSISCNQFSKKVASEQAFAKKEKSHPQALPDLFRLVFPPSPQSFLLFPVLCLIFIFFIILSPLLYVRLLFIFSSRIQVPFIPAFQHLEQWLVHIRPSEEIC